MNKEAKEACKFILPLVFFILFFLLLPIIATFWISLWQDVSFLPRKFIGLWNYARLTKDAPLWHSVTFTLLFCFASVAIEMALGMIIALVINERVKLRGAIRGIALLPWAIPTVIGARIWELIYRYDYGFANYILSGTLGTSVNWLGSPVAAFFSIVLADVWRNTPFVAIILLAGLQAIPEDLYKQAKTDGANLFERFIKITLPLIKPILIVALLFRTVDALRVFDIIYVITGGGPGGVTTSISLYAYKYYLLGDFGYGSAISTFLFMIAFGIAIIYIKIANFKEAIS